MKNNIIFMALVATALIICAASCSKEQFIDMPKVEEEAFAVYDMELQFAAEGVAEAQIEFYNDLLEVVSVETIAVPDNSATVVPTSFMSDSKPVWIYTEGLENVDSEVGMLRIDEKAIKTKAGQEPILLVIKKN